MLIAQADDREIERVEDNVSDHPLEKLGPSRFGLLLVILSISSWIGFANIGMGRVVANMVARRRNLAGEFASKAISLATMIAGVFNALLFVR